MRDHGYEPSLAQTEGDGKPKSTGPERKNKGRGGSGGPLCFRSADAYDYLVRRLRHSQRVLSGHLLVVDSFAVGLHEPYQLVVGFGLYRLPAGTAYRLGHLKPPWDIYAVIIAAAIGSPLAFAWQEMSVRIYLTGPIAIEVDGRVLVGERQLRGRQGRLVFAYLVCERTRPVSREELATIVWPEETPPSWESALSALTSRLGGLLSARALKSKEVRFARGLGHYQIHLPVDVWVDLEAGVSAIDRAESALRSGAPDRVLGPATVAATIARRPFLSGIDGFWEDSQRRRLERQLVRALDCLAEMRIASGEPDLAVESAIEAVRLDPFRERSRRLLMQGYESTGNRARAVDAYHALRERLAEELGTEPAPETEALYLKLLNQ